MKKCIAILILILSFLGCKNNTHGQDISKCNDKEIYSNFVNSFYDWYLNKIYKIDKGLYFMPSFTKLGEKSYVFDIRPIVQKLRKTEYFSENYIRNDSLKIDICNKEMLKMKWDYEPEPGFNIQPCTFLWKDRIIGGQGENLDSFKIIGTTLKGDNSAIVNIDTYEKENKAYNIKVRVINIGNCNLKIDSIEIKWIRYK